MSNTPFYYIFPSQIYIQYNKQKKLVDIAKTFGKKLIFPNIILNLQVLLSRTQLLWPILRQQAKFGFKYSIHKEGKGIWKGTFSGLRVIALPDYNEQSDNEEAEEVVREGMWVDYQYPVKKGNEETNALIIYKISKSNINWVFIYWAITSFIAEKILYYLWSKI